MAKGGKRAGAGRKPSTLKGIAKKLPAWSAALILAEINANKKWIELANSEDESIAFQVLKFLTEQAHGKAKQTIGGDPEQPFQVNVTIRRIGA